MCVCFLLQKLFTSLSLFPVGCGILGPQPRIEPKPSKMRAQNPNHWTCQGMPLVGNFYVQQLLTNTWPSYRLSSSLPLSLSLLCSCSSEQLRPGVGFLFTRCRFSRRASPRSSTSIPATSLASFAISFPEGSASIHHPDTASLFSVCTHHARH